MIEVIKKPDITKKISTPIKPPVRVFGIKWNITTAMTAIALKALISYLKLFLFNLNFRNQCIKWLKNLDLYTFSLMNLKPKKSPTRKLIGLDIFYSKVPLCIGTLEP